MLHGRFDPTTPMLPKPDSSRTNLVMRLRVPWAAGAMGWGRVNRRKIRSALFYQRGWPNPVPRARLYSAALKRLGSYGKVAREFGVTREEVWQYVSLVHRLPPDVIARVAQVGDPMPDRRFSLRALLKGFPLPHALAKRVARRRRHRTHRHVIGDTRHV